MLRRGRGLAGRKDERQPKGREEAWLDEERQCRNRFAIKREHVMPCCLGL